MSSDAQYSEAFFETIGPGSTRSAEVIVPMVIDLISPKSAVDIGCGTGTWLNVLMQHGVCDILGIDGDYIEPKSLTIPLTDFESVDISGPFHLNRSFDICFCLEVAEHLPPHHAAEFIESLSGTAPVILFSAAIPYQGGIGHVNEQWQSYWAELFDSHGYVVFDCVRDRVWGDPEVKRWYQQNVLMFVHADAVETFPGLSRYSRVTDFKQLDKVHPLTYIRTLNRATSIACVSTLGIRTLTRSLINALRRYVRQSLSRSQVGTP